MNLIREIRLRFQEGNSNKVYEVDLCLQSTDLYLVNFRYGRAGSTLKEGTKTPKPVDLDQAHILFDKLVAEKKGKGYWEESASGDKLDVPKIEGSRDEVILQYLNEAIANKGKLRGRKWNLGRIVWRCGELKFQESAPLLLNLWPKKDPLMQYNIIWALGKMQHSGALQGLWLLLKDDKNAPPHVIQMAQTALMHTLEGEDRNTFQAELVASLPDDIRVLYQHNALEGLTTALKSIIELPYISDLQVATEEEQRRRGNRQSASTGSFSQLESATRTIQGVETPAAPPTPAPEPETEPVEVVPPNLVNIIHTLYVLSYRAATPEEKQVRRVVKETVFQLAFKPPFFRTIRRILKDAEFLLDAEFYGQLAYKFELTKPSWTKSPWSQSTYVVINERWVWTNVKKDMQKKNPHLAYSSSTQNYLNRRTWRILRHFAEANDAENYVRIAVGLLLPFTDADGGDIRHSVYYQYRRNAQTNRWESIEIKKEYDTFAAFLTFNHILYQNSPRYRLRHQSARAWECKDNYKPNDPAPDVREEAFPALWDAMPIGLMHLLSESKCGRVHEFAVRALRDNTAFLDKLDARAALMLLAAPYPVTVQLGLEIARKCYDPANPDKVLVKALALANGDEARALSFELMSQNLAFFLTDPVFVCDLATSDHADTRQWLQNAIGDVQMDASTTDQTVMRLIAILFDPKIYDQPEKAEDIGALLLAHFTPSMQKLGLEIIGDLLKHPLAEVQLFAARVLQIHQVKPENLPTNVLSNLIYAASPEVRTIGIGIFGKFPDSVLLQRTDVIRAFCLSTLPDMRQAIRPVVARLAKEYPSFGELMLRDLLPHLIRPESTEGLHIDLSLILGEDLASVLHLLDAETTWRLLNAPNEPAQQLGESLLKQFIKPESLSIRQMVDLGNHEFLGVRQKAWQYFTASVSRIKHEPSEALRILDAKWDDSRAFAFGYFREQFTTRDWTPDLLISIADSNRLDVQAFGRELITRFFNKHEGEIYLLKLSEHPSPALQLYVTDLLEQFAQNSAQKLDELTYFFFSVLSRVNTGGITKKRVLNFLHQEALKSAASAEIVAELMNRLSLTTAVGEKATYIETLRDIQAHFPNVHTFAKTQKVEVR